VTPVIGEVVNLKDTAQSFKQMVGRNKLEIPTIKDHKAKQSPSSTSGPECRKAFEQNVLVPCKPNPYSNANPPLRLGCIRAPDNGTKWTKE
jgi:hypothetical protein